MIASGLLARIVACGVILCVGGLAGLSLVASPVHLRPAEEAPSLSWPIAKLEVDLALLALALARTSAGEPLAARGDDVAAPHAPKRAAVAVALARIRQQLDLLADPALADRIATLDQDGVLQRLTGAVPSGTVPDAAAIERAVAAIHPLAQRVRVAEDLARIDMQDAVRRAGALNVTLSLSAVALGILGMIVFSAQSRRARAIADANLTLAEEAERARRATARFLGMMSHDLRTPMNGILGMIALAKQPALPRPQQRLLDQAERAGREMAGLLETILDYTELQQERLAPARMPFAPASLGRAVLDGVDPVIRREGAALDLALVPGMPPRVLGDLPRLSQALSLIAGYLVGTAGVRDLRLVLAHDGLHLVATLGFAYRAGGAEAVWRPEVLLGTHDTDPDQVAHDALGPAVARTIIAHMRGRIDIESPPAGPVRIVVQVPAEPVSGAPLVRIETRSATLGLIARAAVAAAEMRVHADGTDLPVEVVVLEAGGEDEARHLRALRQRFPTARLVALGRPADPRAFDAVAGLPLDAAGLRAAIERRRAS